MKQIVLLIGFCFLFSQAEVDTTKKLPVFDLSKGFNIPGIIPKNIVIYNKVISSSCKTINFE